MSPTENDGCSEEQGGWDYRIVRSTIAETHTFSIREVFYNGDGSVFAISRRPEYPYGDDPEELRDNLREMLADSEKPVLIGEEIDFDTSEVDKMIEDIESGRARCVPLDDLITQEEEELTEEWKKQCKELRTREELQKEISELKEVIDRMTEIILGQYARSEKAEDALRARETE
jgi:hypothetical protein